MAQPQLVKMASSKILVSPETVEGRTNPDPPSDGPFYGSINPTKTTISISDTFSKIQRSKPAASPHKKDWCDSFRIWATCPTLDLWPT